MKWDRLLSDVRLHDKKTGKNDKISRDQIRSHFQRDYDSIVFSSAFRRLKNKTQVHCKGATDYARTRLAHSIEVASVARSLGKGLGIKLQRNETQILHMAQILQAAGLAHDIGHPPYGHVGEDKIQEFFESGNGKNIVGGLKEKRDFTHFDSNASTFSTLVRRQSWREDGGLRLTCGILATVCKYPHTSDRATKKKFGFFIKDKDIYAEVAEETGLIRKGENEWCQHPLAYLLEAADDICYTVVDLEDATREAGKEKSEVIDRFRECLRDDDKKDLPKDQDDQISILRGRLINLLIHEIIDLFMQNYDRIMRGEQVGNLIDQLAERNDQLGMGITKIKEMNKDIYYKANEKAKQGAIFITEYLGQRLDKTEEMDYENILEALEYTVGCTEDEIEKKRNNPSSKHFT